MPGETTLFERIYDLVEEIPIGEVATYGQIAFVVSAPTPRVVGFAMAGLPDGSKVPWHRVINAAGRLSPRKDGVESAEQRRLLRAEGVLFDRVGRVDFACHAWRGPSWQWLEEHGYDPGELALRSGALQRRGGWCRWHL